MLLGRTEEWKTLITLKHSVLTKRRPSQLSFIHIGNQEHHVSITKNVDYISTVV